MIFILVIVFMVNACFTRVIHNRYFGIVPGFRNKACHALFVLVLASSALISLLYWLAAPSGISVHPLRIFLFAFIYISAYFLVSQLIINYFINVVWIFIALPLLIVIYVVNLKPAYIYLSNTDATLIAVLFIITLLLWSAWFRLIVNVPEISQLKFDIGLWQDKDTSLFGKLYIRILGRPLTASGTLLRGWPDNWTGRLTAYLLVVHAIPLSMGLTLSLLRLDLKLFNLAYGNFYLVYGITFILVICHGTGLCEYVRRCRYLWLRSSGDRMGHWRLMEKVLLQEAFIFNACLVTLALLQVTVFSVPVKIAALFILMSITLNLLSIYMGTYILLSGWSPAGNVLTLILFPLFLYLTVLLSVNTGYFLSAYIAVIMLFAGAAYLFRRLTIKAFWVVDWCALRPLPARKKLGSMGI